MLVTLTSLSAGYSILNKFLKIRNKNLLNNNNEFLTLRGKKNIKQTTVFKDEISYKINYITDNDFEDSLLVSQTKKFVSTDECKNYCDSNNLEFDNHNYNKIFIDDPNYDNVWILINSRKYTIIRKMSYNEFKSQIIKTHQLPLNKLNGLLFLILMIMCYESI
jgi:hypothetical protein